MCELNPPIPIPCLDSFQYWNTYTAVVGAVVPLLALFGINVVMTLAFMGARPRAQHPCCAWHACTHLVGHAPGIFILLVILFAVLAPPTDFGDVSRAIIFYQVRKYLLRLDEQGEQAHHSNKFWRPSPLFISTQVATEDRGR